MKVYVYCNKCEYKTKEHDEMLMAIVEALQHGAVYTYKHNNDRCPLCKAKNSLKQSKQLL
ncbi:hypothetical protein BC351_30140 [Paenibacillus ferrarius]|uniref:Uncharacterized protein n=1 Tax=Paenibacillus ferrarius TaxID=1469647 RepID=A0A1V4HHP5_9BACL|nr:hypothetical protein BC351_30140 [Paenibacillus ferrarius]